MSASNPPFHLRQRVLSVHTRLDTAFPVRDSRAHCPCIRPRTRGERDERNELDRRSRRPWIGHREQKRRRRHGDDRRSDRGVAAARRHRPDTGDRCCRPTGGRVRSRRSRIGSQRVRRIDRGLADHAVVAGHRRWRQRRSARLHRRPLRRAVAGAAVGEQLERRGLLRDGGRHRRRDGGAAPRPHRVGHRRNGTGGSTDVQLRRRSGGAVRHRRQRSVRHRHG